MLQVSKFFGPIAVCDKGYVLWITNTGKQSITYDDGYVEHLAIADEIWRYESSVHAASDSFLLHVASTSAFERTVDILWR